MENPLEPLAREQKRWSSTASQLKIGINRARNTVLTLAIVAAVSETLGAQIHLLHADIAVILGYLGAAALGILAVIRQWALGRDRLQAWILARAASESFKREMYLFRMSAGAYAGGDPIVSLYTRREEILSKVKSAQRYVVEGQDPIVSPGFLDAETYIIERVGGQVAWFRARAAQYSRNQQTSEFAEFGLAVVGAFLGAALTMTGKQPYGAWVAVVTTMVGVLGAHVITQQYEQLTVSYRTTADRLEGIVGKWRTSNPSSGAILAEQCEAVLYEENQGWIAGIDEMTASVTTPDKSLPNRIAT